jgi:hypothetical protein
MASENATTEHGLGQLFADISSKTYDYVFPQFKADDKEWKQDHDRMVWMNITSTKSRPPTAFVSCGYDNGFQVRLVFSHGLF